jgi:hypothetical protein
MRLIRSGVQFVQVIRQLLAKHTINASGNSYPCGETLFQMFAQYLCTILLKLQKSNPRYKAAVLGHGIGSSTADIQDSFLISLVQAGDGHLHGKRFLRANIEIAHHADTKRRNIAGHPLIDYFFFLFNCAIAQTLDDPLGKKSWRPALFFHAFSSI